jgi:hypothetical protein
MLNGSLFSQKGPITLNVDFENLRPYALRAREYGWAIAQPTASIDETPKRENELWKYMCEQMGIHEARELTIPGSQKLFFTLSGADLTKEQADDLQRNYKTSIYYMAVFRYLDADGSERQQDFCAVKAGVNPRSSYVTFTIVPRLSSVAQSHPYSVHTPKTAVKVSCMRVVTS